MKDGVTVISLIWFGLFGLERVQRQNFIITKWLTKHVHCWRLRYRRGEPWTWLTVVRSTLQCVNLRDDHIYKCFTTNRSMMGMSRIIALFPALPNGSIVAVRAEFPLRILALRRLPCIPFHSWNLVRTYHLIRRLISKFERQYGSAI